MRLSDFDYALPPALIARDPPPERDGARLLRVPLDGGAFEHATFRDLPALLAAGDILVLNDARVFKARLRGHKVETGGEVELLLERPLPAGRWSCLGSASKGFRVGQRLAFSGGEGGAVVEVQAEGFLVVDFGDVDVLALARAQGEIPLPPYLGRPPEARDDDRYQTVFAQSEGAVAAPTAGLHFTDEVFRALSGRGVGTTFLTLLVGPGTFLPVRGEDVEAHRMRSERYVIPEAAVSAIAAARRAGGRVVAVGTTVTRALESAVDTSGVLRAGPGETDLFIRPGHRFRAIDGLLTNFHLPRSTLLMLVSALAGRERVLAAYAEAVERRYRFFSYGDCSLFL